MNASDDGSIIVRKNVVTFSCQFYAPPPVVFPPAPPSSYSPVIQNPTSAWVTLRFKGLNGLYQLVTVMMTLDTATNIWSANWDSSAAQGGKIDSPDAKCDWAIWGDGLGQAAQEGYFFIEANTANVN